MRAIDVETNGQPCENEKHKVPHLDSCAYHSQQARGLGLMRAEPARAGLTRPRTDAQRQPGRP